MSINTIEEACERKDKPNNAYEEIEAREFIHNYRQDLISEILEKYPDAKALYDLDSLGEEELEYIARYSDGLPSLYELKH